jgi:nitrite reductase/ring-hydroxylating ferredoxin subunit/uncharacterized membrane protein
VPDRRRLTPLEQPLTAIESAEALDEPAQAIAKQVRDTLSGGPLKDLLSGTWLGHAVHPMLTDVVIGSFTSASMLDLVGGGTSHHASRKLIGLGLLAYLPTAATGLNDWADTEPVDGRVRRVGAVHAGANALGALLYALSLRRRRRGHSGRLLGLMGLGVLSAGGYLGGHLSFTRGVGPDQTVFDRGPTDWTPAADAAQLPEGRPTRIVVEDTPVLLLREGESFYAIHDRCSHRGCSLSDGELDGEEIVCACHGSRFDRRNGAVTSGPATAPQPAFQVRVSDGRVEVRLLDN